MRAGATAAPDPHAVFAALADPTRRSLVGHLAGHSPKTATQLAAAYPITRQGLLKHLAVLENAGLVRVQQAGREKRYSLTPEPLADVAAWVAEIGALWDTRLLRLKALVEGAHPDEEARFRPAHAHQTFCDGPYQHDANQESNDE